MKAYGLNESSVGILRTDGYEDVWDHNFTGSPSRCSSKKHGDRTSKYKLRIRRRIKKAGRRHGKSLCNEEAA